MDRLQAELQRLRGAGGGGAAVLEVTGAGAWAALAKAWQGAQADLELPAPGIAVNGADACQLWFWFDHATHGAQGGELLGALRARYLPELPGERVRIQLQPTAVPPFQSAPERWSAFVTPDLAALFDETPWLDLPPGADAQAELLSRLQPIGARELQRALQRLQPPAEAASSALHAATNDDDPRRFLLRVMNDAGVEMRLRIEAAKALLLAAEGSPR